MGRPRTERRRTAEPKITAVCRPDMTRQVQALRLILMLRGRKREQAHRANTGLPSAVESRDVSDTVDVGRETTEVGNSN